MGIAVALKREPVSATVDSKVSNWAAPGSMDSELSYRRRLFVCDGAHVAEG